MMQGTMLQHHNEASPTPTPVDVSNLMAKLDDIESLNIQDSMTSFSFTRVSDSLASLEEMARYNDGHDEEHGSQSSKKKRIIFSNYWDKTGGAPAKPRPFACTQTCRRGGSSDPFPLLRRQHAVAGGLNNCKTKRLEEQPSSHVRFDPMVEVAFFERPLGQWQESGWENLFNHASKEQFILLCRAQKSYSASWISSVPGG